MAKPRSAEQATKQRSLMQEAWLQFKSNRLAICGLIVIGLLLLISIVTTVIDLGTAERFTNSSSPNKTFWKNWMALLPHISWAAMNTGAIFSSASSGERGIRSLLAYAQSLRPC